VDGEKLRKIFGSGWFWLVFALAGYGLWMAGATMRYHQPKLPDAIGQVPNFQLTDQDGTPFGTQELTGKIWVGAWIEDPKGEVGQLAASAMEDVLRKMIKAKDSFCLVLIGGDPSRTPSPARGRWRSLHGESPALEALRPTLGADPRTLMLIDRQGKIRGRYGTDKAGQKALLRDFTLILSLDPAVPVQNGKTST
jgi:cytochrome oxidase Cu insertion factor (SCO1/SenC/PrrC family)